MTSPFKTSASITALMFLAACGGQAPGESSAPTSLNTKATQDSPQTAPQPGPADNEHGSETAPLTKNSIRGDVIKAALLHSPNLFPQKDGNPIVVYASAENIPVRNWSGPYEPDFSTDTPMQLLQLTTKDHDSPGLGQQIFSNTTFTAPDSVTFHSFRLRFGLDDTTDGLTIGRVLELAKLPGHIKRAYADEDKQQMSADSVKFIRDEDRFPFKDSFNSPIQRWKAASEESTVLFVQDRDEQSFSLCLKALLDRHERETCTTWKIPGNWQRGQALEFVNFGTRDIETVKDINGLPPYRDMKAEFYWGGIDDMPHMLTEPASAPLSDKGISGAALSAMFDSWTKAKGSNPNLMTLHATSAPDEPTPSTEEPQSVELSQHDKRAWADNMPLDIESYRPAAGYTAQLEIKSASSRAPDGRQAGEVPGFESEYLNPMYGVTLVDGKPVFLLQGMMFRPEQAKPFAARLDALVPFGELNAWHVEHQKQATRLELRPHADADKAELCWMLGNPMHREICQTWQIPADWHWGQPLRVVSARVMNDQTADGNSKRYWQWSSMDEQAPQPEAPAATPSTEQP
ncbi:MAG: hypothetical protein Q4D91_04225 [Lautropia sp.]|nr:hypothetical protein [Lautropia sp.]